MAYTEGPVSIRYPRSSREVYEPTGDESPWELGKSRTLREGSDVAILAVGNMVYVALEAAGLLAAQGIECSVVDMRWVKPLDVDAVERARKARLVVTLEDGTTIGGFGDAVLERLGEGPTGDGTGVDHPHLVKLGFPDTFVDHGSVDELYADFGLEPDQVAERIAAELEG